MSDSKTNELLNELRVASDSNKSQLIVIRVLYSLSLGYLNILQLKLSTYKAKDRSFLNSVNSPTRSISGAGYQTIRVVER